MLNPITTFILLYVHKNYFSPDANIQMINSHFVYIHMKHKQNTLMRYVYNFCSFY